MSNLVWILPLSLALLYLLSLRGRRGHRGWEALRGHVYAHRGLHNKTIPENSLAAFRAALEHGYGIELDVHLLADGELAVMHDHSLLRTTGVKGRIEHFTVKRLSDYHLEGTDEHIPTLREVLRLVDSRTPMIIELKAAGNWRKLVDTVCEQLHGYNGAYCIESFDPRCLWFLRRYHPEIIRGQLAQDFIKRGEDGLPWIGRFFLTYQMLNFLTRPDFSSYRFSDRHNLSDWLVRKVWGVQGVSWTLRSPAEHAAALAEDRLPIFEFYEP